MSNRMSGRAVRRLSAFLVVVAAALVGAAAADAAVVSVSLQSPSEGTLVYEAAEGETNRVTVEMTSDLATWQVTETGAPLVAGPGCTSVDAHRVSCTAPAGNRVVHIVDIALGDMNDWASGARSCFYREFDLHGRDAFCNTMIDGGVGDDTLIGNEGSDAFTKLSGGGGDDVLRGQGSSRLEGGAGADVLRGGSGDNSLDGGLGADTIIGDGWSDTVTYSDRVGRFFVSLNGRRDDGERGENDLVLGIKNVVTGSGDDVIVGDSSSNDIEAGDGNDVVYAGGGNDAVYGDSTACGFWDIGSPGGADRIYGQSGDDQLFGCGGNNAIYGGEGGDFILGKDGADRLFGLDQADTIIGGFGNDMIGGGRGQDDLRGQQGNDTFYARDGQADRIVGWTGYDRAQIDRGLDRRSSIERLF
jgi:Ca2+-binding RTX toxin-like protein